VARRDFFEREVESENRSPDRRDLNNTHGSWPIANRTLAAALGYAGYDHRFVLGDGWHSRVQGAHHLPDTLRWMLGEGAREGAQATEAAEASPRL